MSRVHKVKDVDCNSKFFHAMAVVRKRKKMMTEIKEGRRAFRSPRMIKTCIRDFFKKLYSQKSLSEILFLDNLINRISVANVETLEVFPNEEEIKGAVWCYESSKAPSPDGFNFSFIKKCWHIIGKEFTECVENFFQTDNLPQKANMMLVTLIPKVDDAKEIREFKSKSMIGYIYKVMTKILANHLTSVMDGLVGETQSAFVQGTQILNGALIANEVVHWAKKKKKKIAMLKLDFHKAYDSSVGGLWIKFWRKFVLEENGGCGCGTVSQ